MANKPAWQTRTRSQDSFTDPASEVLSTASLAELERQTNFLSDEENEENNQVTLEYAPDTCIGDVLDRHKELWRDLRLHMKMVLSAKHHPYFGRRANALKNLAESLKTIQLGERMAWGLKDETLDGAKIITVGFIPAIMPIAPSEQPQVEILSS